MMPCTDCSPSPKPIEYDVQLNCHRFDSPTIGNGCQHNSCPTATQSLTAYCTRARSACSRCLRGAVAATQHPLQEHQQHHTTTAQ